MKYALLKCFLVTINNHVSSNCSEYATEHTPTNTDAFGASLQELQSKGMSNQRQY